MKNKMASIGIKYRVSGKFQGKTIPFVLIGGVFFLLIILCTAGLIGQGTTEFDSKLELEIERFHTQIIAENYADVYLQSGRRLVASFGHQEFENRLRAARPQLIGKMEKNCTTFYTDMVERLKRNLFMSFQLETVCQMENETMKSYQYFDWRVGSNRKEIKLIWFGTEPRK